MSPPGAPNHRSDPSPAFRLGRGPSRRAGPEGRRSARPAMQLTDRFYPGTLWTTRRRGGAWRASQSLSSTTASCELGLDPVMVADAFGGLAPAASAGPIGDEGVPARAVSISATTRPRRTIPR
jgi:hypothetical protein